ncbi:MAG: low-specificity L-threonine aldolase [Verrucomicrobiota bacterium]|nr:low-specificity L-threonine aldolase [Verrucomicrobiota bacterium]
MGAIDLRSDTVTRPTGAMREAMMRAELGDDVFGDDPSVMQLESMAAEMLGKEDALFAPSGTQTNLIALLTHCARGHEYIVGQQAHTYLFEGGGGAVLGGIQPQPLDQEDDGSLSLDRVEALIKPDDYHFARTRLLCLENTTWGKVLSLDYLKEARNFTNEKGLRLHLDGARLFNAAVASGVAAKEIAGCFDSVSVCLSKGLGAPVGSLLLGGKEFVREGKRWRKMLGGGMRQSGLLAAAGMHALEHHVERLADDHAKASRLAEGLSGIPGVMVDPVHSNMVLAALPEASLAGIAEYMRSRDILILGASGGRIRMVTHLDIPEEAIDRVVDAFADYLS